MIAKLLQLAVLVTHIVDGEHRVTQYCRKRALVQSFSIAWIRTPSSSQPISQDELEYFIAFNVGSLEALLHPPPAKAAVTTGSKWAIHTRERPSPLVPDYETMQHHLEKRMVSCPPKSLSVDSVLHLDR
eukprot:5076321-Amphidinium_carterae.2